MHIFNVNQGDDGGDTTMDKPQKALPVIGKRKYHNDPGS
jgi:hypothetical protein